VPSARKAPPISFDAVQQTRQLVRPVQDRIVYEIDIASITPSPRNPREDLGDVDELAESIEAFDLLQPVVVRRLGDDQYELIAGHRRFAAVQQLGRTKIAAVVRDADQDQAYLMTLAENLAREDLTPAEEAAGLAVLVREHGWSLRQVAEAIHKSPAFVSLRLRVFEAEDLRAPVLEEQLSVSAAEELLRVPPELRPDLIDQAIREHWTPTEARRARLAARAKCLESKHARSEASTASLEERFRALRADLQAIDRAQISHSARREAKRLLGLLQELVDANR
jgi:ParB family chromosome partitioning protein